MSFTLKIDDYIEDLNTELLKVRNAKIDKDFHISFVSNKINESIKKLANNNPDNPTGALGETLSNVSSFLAQSFDHLENIETNILVTTNAYKKIKNDLIAYENRIMQEADILEKSKEPSSNKIKDDQDGRKIRKPGQRPDDKLKERKSKKKLKNKSKKGEDKK